MANNNKKPDVVLLTKSKNKNKRSNVIEYIQSKDSPIVPRHLVDAIFISLASGEKYKISKKVIKSDVEVDHVWQLIEGLGVPEDINTIEILLDIDEAEQAIIAESASILDKVFN